MTNPFADIERGVGEFDTAPVTGVTRPGTVLGKPGIERFDDAEASIDMFDDLPPGASTTGTPIFCVTGTVGGNDCGGVRTQVLISGISRDRIPISRISISNH